MKSHGRPQVRPRFSLRVIVFLRPPLTEQTWGETTWWWCRAWQASSKTSIFTPEGRCGKGGGGGGGGGYGSSRIGIRTLGAKKVNPFTPKSKNTFSQTS